MDTLHNGDNDDNNNNNNKFYEISSDNILLHYRNFSLPYFCSLSTVVCLLLTSTVKIDSVILRNALFWVVTLRVVAISYRHFWTTYRPHFQGSKMQEKGSLSDP